MVVSAIFGLISILIGAIGLYVDFGGWLTYDLKGSSPDVLKYWTAKDGLVLGQVLINFVFVLAAMLCLVLIKMGHTIFPFLAVCGMLYLLISAGLFLVYFKEGWYYITDPAGHSKFAIWVLLFGLGQGAEFFFAKKD